MLLSGAAASGSDFVSLDNVNWESIYGAPDSLPPLAWCSPHGMGVAIPAPRRAAKWIPQGTNVTRLDDGYLYVYPKSLSAWDDNNNLEDCKAGFSSQFFSGRRRRKAAAWLGETKVTACGTQMVRIDPFVVYSNTFRPPNTDLEVFVSCTCPLNGKESCQPAVRQSRDVPLVGQGEDLQSAASLKLTANLLTTRSTVGQNLDKDIFLSDARLTFQLRLDPADRSTPLTPEMEVAYPWPETCVVTSMEGEPVPIIVAGCPVSKALDFQIHSTASARTLVFSTLPFHTSDDARPDDMMLRCQVSAVRKVPAEMLEECYRPITGDNMDIAPPQINAPSDSRYLSKSPTAVLERPSETTSSSEIRGEVEATKPKKQQNTVENGAARKRKIRGDRSTEFRKSSRPNRQNNSAPTRRLQEISNAQRRDASFAVGSMGGNLGGTAPSHPQWTGDNPRQEYKEKMEKESASRLKILREAVEEGSIGEAHVMIEKAVLEGQEFENEPLGGGARNGNIMPHIFNQYIAGPAVVTWGGNTGRGSAETSILTPGGYGMGGITRSARSGYFATGARGNSFQVAADEMARAASVGFGRKWYGLVVDRQMNERSTAVEARMRNVDVVSVTDILDRSYGQRVGVRNFGINIRHDLDDLVSGNDGDAGTEFLVQYKSIGVSVATDVLDTRYFISVGMMGVNVAAARDFNSYANNLQVNWGRGWQIFLESDFPDDLDPGIAQAVGVGKPNRMYLSVGSGVGPDMLPQAAVNLQLPFSAIGVGVLEKVGRRIAQYSITAGRFTYLWESVLIPDNLRVPLMMG